MTKTKLFIVATTALFALGVMPVKGASLYSESSKGKEKIENAEKSGISIPTLVGSWRAQGIAVHLDPNDPIAVLGGPMAEKLIEQELDKQLVKYKVNAKELSIKIKKGGTFLMAYKGEKKTLKGTYKYTPEERTLSLKFPKLPSVTFHVTGTADNCKLMTSVDKLFTLVKQVGKQVKNEKVAAIIELASHYKGLKLGLRLTK